MGGSAPGAVWQRRPGRIEKLSGDAQKIARRHALGKARDHAGR